MNGERHPGDLLSSLLDGELDQLAAGGVRAHVSSCPACATELDVVRVARRAVRTLPAVEPPPQAPGAPLSDRRAAPVLALGRHRAARSRMAASVAAGIGVVALGAGAIDPAALAPEVRGAVESHAATVSAMSAGGLLPLAGADDPLMAPGTVTPSTQPARSERGLEAPFDAPHRLGGGYELVRVFRHPRGVQLVYESGTFGLSVFEAVGHVDFAALPAGGRRLDVAGSQGWQWESPEVAGRVVVVDHDGMAVTFVGDEPGDAVLEAARSMPDPPPLSLLQRLRRVAGSVLETLNVLG